VLLGLGTNRVENPEYMHYGDAVNLTLWWLMAMLMSTDLQNSSAVKVSILSMILIQDFLRIRVHWRTILVQSDCILASLN
jgi:hypothetical protein